jgi:hypothetical protein
MLRATLYVIILTILPVGVASAQTAPHIDGISGYSPMRNPEERIHDRELDRAYETTIKSTKSGRDAEKNSSDPWGDVRSTPPAAAKNKQKP